MDDPVPRDSRHNYLIQMADLCAYAAFRAIYPPSPKVPPIVPQTMWDELGAARLWQANMYSGGPPGVVIRP